MRFLGNIEARLDTKNRVFIPAVFRKVLVAEAQQTLYLRKDVYQDCIIVYPQLVWEEELSLLRSKLNKWNPEEQDLYRQFMLEAEVVESDISGRILISRHLLSSVGIETDVRFLGVDNTIEIWPKNVLEKPRVDPEVFRKKMQILMTNNLQSGNNGFNH
jgi:MraZ protein